MSNPDFPSLPILMVDDEEHLLFGFDTILRSSGYNHIVSCNDSRDVKNILKEKNVGMVLLDLYMPHISGEEILEMMSHDYPHIPVIIITGVDTVETAVKCIKTGAFDYIVKPVEEGRLLSSVKRALELLSLKSENSYLKEQILERRIKDPDIFFEIVTNHPKMLSIFQYAQSIALSPMPILITGETGTGKELLVQSIHKIASPGSSFVKLNVAGLDDAMFSDTLFGHRKGSFTGAEQERQGLVRQASGGTLFLDEIGDLSIPSQVKLLRLIQNREYYPVGSDESEFSDARIIVATNHSLKDLFHMETFRKDLYYRLQTHHIHIPALRERKTDIPILIEHFLEQAAKAMEKSKPTVPEELFLLLKTYHFPGNVRELQSMVFDAMSSHESKMMSMDSFKTYLENKSFSQPAEEFHPDPAAENLYNHLLSLPTLQQAQADLIEEALKRSEGNQSIASRILGISRQALNRRIKK